MKKISSRSHANRLLLTWLILIMGVFFTTFVSAAIVNEAHGQTITGSPENQSGKTGMQILMNQDAELGIVVVNMNQIVDPSHAYILNGANQELVNTTINASGYADFGGYALSSGSHYVIAVDKAGSPYSLTTSSTATGFPYSGTTLDWTGAMNWNNATSSAVDSWIFSVELLQMTVPDFGEISLESPLNGSTISDVGTNFTVSGNDVTSLGANWTNVTFNLWDNESALHNSTTVDFTDDMTFNETLFIDDFTFGTYTWNALGCYENVTGTYCVEKATNSTFNVVPISVLDTTYYSEVVEGSRNLFATNISIISTERMSTVNFVYNSVSYPLTPTQYDTNEWYMPINITVPTVATNTNFSFYWNIRLESGLVYNTSSINQTVYNIAIDNCSSYSNQLFNFTMVDEKTQAFLNGTTQNTSLKIDLSFLNFLNNEVVNFSTSFEKINPSRVCLNYPIGNSTLILDAVIEYTSSGKFVEFYNIQNYTYNKDTTFQNITLYNLEEAEGQEFKITYKGLDFIPISDLIVQIQRKYIEEGVFKTIEIPMSGTNGYTIAHLVPNDVIYNLIFIKDGSVLDTFTDVIATCQNPTFTDCEINLNALITGTDLFGLVEEDDFFSSLSYNTDTRTISSTYGIVSGVSGNTTLEVYLLDNFGTTEVCSDSLIAAGGTLSCVIPESFGNSSVHAVLKLDGVVRREGFISMAQKPKEIYAGVLILMSLIMFLFIVGIGVQDNPAIMGIFLILGLIILVGLNFVYSTSWIGPGATVLWFVVAVVMILVKGGKR